MSEKVDNTQALNSVMDLPKEAIEIYRAIYDAWKQGYTHIEFKPDDSSDPIGVKLTDKGIHIARQLFEKDDLPS